VHSVPPEIVASVSDAEKKRQEAINEVIYTERDFVRDLEYLRDVSLLNAWVRWAKLLMQSQVWMKRLREEDIIPIERRADFLQHVFWNITDIIAVNTRLRDALNKRQKQYAVVERIGDILLDHVPHFDPFLSYGAHQLWGKYEFEKEKNSNPVFAHFVEVWSRNCCPERPIKSSTVDRTATRVEEARTECIPHEAYHPFSAIPSAP
jgi:RHO1 GDP-GTP exchange protein 1/2